MFSLNQIPLFIPSTGSPMRSADAIEAYTPLVVLAASKTNSPRGALISDLSIGLGA
jgi:hypothetical protein